jgi:hypothetical protein
MAFLLVFKKQLADLQVFVGVFVGLTLTTVCPYLPFLVSTSVPSLLD